MARVEDHDNLVSVFNAQSEVVTDIYGEYFIAELIEAQNDENKALVAEVDGRAVGLMCLTSDVDVNVLAQCFQLDAMDHLLKPQYAQKVRDQAVRVAVQPSRFGWRSDLHTSRCRIRPYSSAQERW